MSVEWVDPQAIRFKITPSEDLQHVAGGDWDIERRQALTEAPKHRALVQRYVEGRRWEDTDLFLNQYRRRFAAGGAVRGEQTMPDLLRQYYERVDGMFEEMKANGFRVVGSGGRRYPLPRLLIGRGGEVFIGNQGNHRLAMAHILKLSEIAGEVVCRHRMCLSTA